MYLENESLGFTLFLSRTKRAESRRRFVWLKRNRVIEHSSLVRVRFFFYAHLIQRPVYVVLFSNKRISKVFFAILKKKTVIEKMKTVIDTTSCDGICCHTRNVWIRTACHLQQIMCTPIFFIQFVYIYMV